MAVCAQADCEQLLSLLHVVCLQAEFENLLALFVRLCGDEIWGVRKVRARNRGCNNHSNNSRHNSRATIAAAAATEAKSCFSPPYRRALPTAGVRRGAAGGGGARSGRAAGD